MERIHKRLSDYGTIDYYKWYKQQTNTKLKSSQYTKILREINFEFGKTLSFQSEDIFFFNGLGELYIEKKKSCVSLKEDGKIFNPLPIDRKATYELWNSNPQAKAKKVLIRFENKHTEGYVYKVKYNKKKCFYNNKSVYRFKANRVILRNLAQGIKKGEIKTKYNATAYV